jgi:1-acyl-sn-glycerol-3-phosphate acyltransferase
VSLYRLVAVLNRVLIRLLFRPRVRGVEHVPRSGGYVVAPNHLSGFDVWAVAYPLYRRDLRNMAKNQLFHRRFLGPLVRGLGAFPAREEAGAVGGVEAAAALARAGGAVVIFPTGARRRLDKTGRARTGAARTALEAGVPLIPAALRGTDGWRRLERWEIAFGQAIPLDDLAGQEPSRVAREATNRLAHAIVSLELSLGPEYDRRVTYSPSEVVRMRAPVSEDEVRGLLENLPEKTQTHPVERDLLSRLPVDAKVELRALNDDEVRELAEYLEVDSAELDGPFRVVDAKCDNCGRQISFLDFVHSAVDEGAHEKDQLRDVLTGRAGAWLTIRGTDGGRPVTCIVCGALARVSEYSEYSGSSYAYA